MAIITRLARTRSIAVAVIAALILVACGGTTATDTASTNTASTETTSTSNAIAAPTVPPANAVPTAGPTAAAPTAEPTTPATAAPIEATPTEAPTIADFEPPTGIVPTRIEITAINVNAPTIELSLAGPEPEVPQDFADTGWYTQTRLPGELGPAIIAGHIDSRSGPAVFANLDQLATGDEITIYDDTGDSRTFVVVDAAQYPKGDLPDSVFGFGAPEPELRLITCGGTFDAATGHYRDNYVVYARLASEPPVSGM